MKQNNKQKSSLHENRNRHCLRFLYIIYICFMSLATIGLPLRAQNTPISQMEKLDRGLIAMPSRTGSGIFVSWRLLGTDDSNTTFTVLRNGQVISKEQYITNFTDVGGRTNDKYQIITYANEIATDTTTTTKPWNVQYLKIVLNRPSKGINGGTYDPNDCSVGDVDGDGEYEIFVKWNPSNAKDNSQSGITDNVYIDCYKLNGTHLWRIDLGPNIRAGAHYTQYMVYDFDCDGRAEMMLKTAPGSKDGLGNFVNEVATETTIKAADNSIIYRNNDGKIIGGQEWLTVFDGLSGKAIHTIFYNPNRDTSYGGAATGTFNWDDRSGHKDYASYGNRGERYLAAVACLDGPDKPASGIFSRGYYTFAYIWAVDFDGQHLKQRWLSSHTSRNSYRLTTYNAEGKVNSKSYNGKSPSSGGGSGTMYGNGNHNLSIADVDGDGCDEIIWGSAGLDNDGTLLYATGFGHGDAIHLADHDPTRHGLELFQIHEEKGTYAWDLHDAATGEILLKGGPAGIDNGRGIAGQFGKDVAGSLFWSSDKVARSAITGEAVSDKIGSSNFRIYWDDDLQEELLDGNKIDKWNNNGTSRLITFGNLGPSSTCNGSKNTPNLCADIFGDWREEVVLYRASDAETCLAVYSTNTPSTHRVPTLMHDHTYRMGICWQNTAYNQPPHLGYYLADLNTPSMADIGKRFMVEMNESVDWTFTTSNTSTIEYSHFTFNGTRQAGMPSGISLTVAGEENPSLKIEGAFKHSGNYGLTFILTGNRGEKATAVINVTCRSHETVEGIHRRWDFTQWSRQTVNNLTLDAEQGDDSGWSDQEYLGTSTPVGNRCFWYHSDSLAGTMKAYGHVITELDGLVFGGAYCAGRSLAIAVDYPSTDIGHYAGPQYLWLGINDAPYCFYIPDVMVGQPITMSVESHRSGQGRGVGIFAMDDNSNLRQIGNHFTPDAKGEYTWEEWILPDEVTDMGGTVDIYIKNTSGCHLYFIDAVVADRDGQSSVDRVATVQHHHTVYNLSGQRVRLPQQGIYIVGGKKYVNNLQNPYIVNLNEPR